MATKATDVQIFSSQNHTTASFVRNVNCWITQSTSNFAAVDLTCISPSNSRGSNLRAGTLITKRHVINSATFPLEVGDVIRFVTQDGNNTTVSRTILSKIVHPDYSPYYPDLVVYTLNSDVPNTITPCKVLPQTFLKYIDTSGSERIPCLVLDQEEKALVADLHHLSNEFTAFKPPVNAKRLEFYEEIVAGDSGNPAFMVIDGELVILTTFTYGGPGIGSSITHQVSAINQMIIDADAAAGVSTGYKLSEINLSNFKKISS